MASSPPKYTLGQLATLLDVSCQGDDDIEITGLATLASAKAGQLSFLANPRYQKDLATTKASAVIVAENMVLSNPVNSLISPDPYLTFAKATQLFSVTNNQKGVHPSAVVSDSAHIDPLAYIGASAVVGANVRIGANTVIGSGAVIGDDSVIGNHCLVYANVSIYHGVTVGDDVIIHSGVVIGGDGFGFSPSDAGWVKITQFGGVRVGDRVEIGANTTIDRGALDDTLIGNGVIIDNQVQIAHNVELGDNTAIAACTAIAGSTVIGKNCIIAGAVGIVGHLEITDNVHITAMSMITKSIKSSGSYSSGTPMQESASWRKNAVRFTQLDTLVKRIQALENKLK